MNKIEKKESGTVALRQKLTIFFCALALVVGMVPAHAFAAPAISTDVVIHKLKVNSGTQPQAHDGTELPSAGLDTLEGVIFKYWTIDPSATDADITALRALATIEAIEAYATANPGILSGGTQTGATGSSGSVTVTGMSEGRYLFGEFNGASNNVTEYIGVPFLLELPAMHVDGSGYFGTGANALHVYPKNVVSNGGLDFKTVDKETGVQIGGGEFSFEIKNGGVWSSIDAFSAGLVVTSGYMVLTDLPAGDYRIINTKAPTDYMLDNRAIYFSVSAGQVTFDTASNPLSEFQVAGGIGGNPLIIAKFVKKPGIDKTVDGSKDKSFEVGDVVPWTIDLGIPVGIEDYLKFDLVDNIDPRLDFLGNVSIELNDGTPLLLNTHYTYSFTPGATTNDKGLFRIVFSPATLQTYVGKTIQATYKTAINELAEMGEEITNDVSLDFNNGHGGQTDPGNPIKPPVTPQVWTGGAKFLKLNDAQAPLPDAEFKIATDAAGTNFMSWTQALIDANAVAISAGQFKTPVVGAHIELISITTGAFEIRGLEGGTYYLVETKAPNFNNVQYNLLRDPAPFVISKTSYDDANEIDVVNKSGLQIPQTGGMGTALFTIAGIVLMGTGLFLLRRKRNKTQGLD